MVLVLSGKEASLPDNTALAMEKDKRKIGRQLLATKGPTKWAK
jgi:hypothetical protein